MFKIEDGRLLSLGESDATQTLEGAYAWATSLDKDTLIGFGVGGGIVAALILIRILLRTGVKLLPRTDEHSASAILERMIGRFRFYFFAAIGLKAAAAWSDAPDAVQAVADAALVVCGVFQAAELVQELSVSLLRRSALKGKHEGGGLASALSVLKWFINIAIWSIAIIVVLDNLGVNVTAMIAGLGVGGIAIGLAAQDLFKDLFAALAILMDRPFKKGDFISSGASGNILGTVEEIGMKSTRIRALSGEQVVITNSNLLQLTLQNFGRMYERRVVIRIGITYQTPADKVTRAAEILKAAVESVEGCRFDRAHFDAYGDSSLDYEMVFYVNTRDYTVYMDRKQEILLKIFRDFEAEGLEFAYPTRTLFMANQDGSSENRRPPISRLSVSDSE